MKRSSTSSIHVSLYKTPTSPIFAISLHVKINFCLIIDRLFTELFFWWHTGSFVFTEQINEFPAEFLLFCGVCLQNVMLSLSSIFHKSICLQRESICVFTQSRIEFVYFTNFENVNQNTLNQ